MLWPAKSRRKTHNKASANNGVAKRRMERASVHEGEERTRAENKAPKKVLPTSPMKTLAGLQFQTRKPRSEPISTQIVRGAPSLNAAALIEKVIQPATRPSIPSVKLVKLIKAVTAIKQKKDKRGVLLEPRRGLTKSNRRAVIT